MWTCGMWSQAAGPVATVRAPAPVPTLSLTLTLLSAQWVPPWSSLQVWGSQRDHQPSSGAGILPSLGCTIWGPPWALGLPWVWGTLPGHWGSPWVWGTFPGHWGSPWKRPRVRAVAILLFQRGGAAGGWSSPRVRVPPRALSLCVSPCGTGTQHPAWAPRSSVLGSLRASLSQGDMDRLVLQVVRGGFLEEVAAEPLRRKGCLPQRGRRPPSSWNSLTSWGWAWCCHLTAHRSSFQRRTWHPVVASSVVSVPDQSAQPQHWGAAWRPQRGTERAQVKSKRGCLRLRGSRCGGGRASS